MEDILNHMHEEDLELEKHLNAFEAFGLKDKAQVFKSYVPPVTVQVFPNNSNANNNNAPPIPIINNSNNNNNRNNNNNNNISHINNHVEEDEEDGHLMEDNRGQHEEDDQWPIDRDNNLQALAKRGKKDKVVEHSVIGDLTREMLDKDFAMEERTAFMKKASIDGDIYYQNTSAFLQSETCRSEFITPLQLFHQLCEDLGYGSCIIRFSAMKDNFVLQIIISLFGDEEDAFHARTVAMVFKSQNPGLKNPSRLVNFIFGDSHVTAADLKRYSSIV